MRAAIDGALCWADALRALGYDVKGANYRTLQKWVKRWQLSTDHFDPDAGRRRAGHVQAIPLKDVLVERSPYPRGRLKRRLYATGLKERICELCGQGEMWRGRRMSLILDHINGISDDHRLENLQIVCPNCAATLDTHCGRNIPRERRCRGCGSTFAPSNMQHRYCSDACWGRVASELYRGVPRPDRRKVSRPALDQLLADLRSMSYTAVGRKYGVSDNAVRKWLRSYENAAPPADPNRSHDDHEP